MTQRSKDYLKDLFYAGAQVPNTAWYDFIDSLQRQVAIDVRDYGAKGDGSADDTTAIQAAITDCPARGMVAIPDGNYITTATLVAAANYVTLRGGSLTQITRSGAGRIMTVTGNNVTLEHLSLTTAAGENNDHGLYVDGGYGLKLSRVLVTGAQKHGVYLASNSNTVQTDHCLFDAAYAGAGYAAFYHGAGSHNVMHLISRFNGAAVAAARIDDGSQIAFIGCDISSTTGGANSLGIDVAGGSNLLIENCYFEGIGKYFVWLGSGAVKVDSPAIKRCYLYVDRSGATGIQVDYASNAKVSGNIIYGPAGTTGIVIRGIDLHVLNCQIDSDNSIGTATTITDAKGRAQNHYGHRVQYAASVPQDGSWWNADDVVHKTGTVAGNQAGWVCTTAGYAVKENWTTGHAYTAGDFVRNPSAGRLYCATTSGTSGATEPTHTTGTASDGAVSWAYVGPSGDAAIFTSFGQVGMRTRSGDPNGVVSAYFIGERLMDTSVYPFIIWTAMNTSGAWTSL